MSAWIVSKAHIDALVNAGIRYGITTVADVHETGQMLWRENHRSINYRYDKRGRTPQYRFTGTEMPLHPIVILKLLHCFEYQSCERPDWEKSQACRWVARLEAALQANEQVDMTPLPARYSSDGTEPAYLGSSIYNDAPWAIATLSQAAVTTEVSALGGRN